MNNLDYFVSACQAGYYARRDWVYSLFTVTELPDVSTYVGDDHENHYNYKLYNKDGIVVYFDYDNEDLPHPAFVPLLLNNRPIKYPLQEPILMINEPMEITSKDIPSLQGDPIITTPGKFFMNWYCFMYGVGKHQPYVNDDNFAFKKVMMKLSAEMVDDPINPHDKNPNVLYCSDFKKSIDAINAFSGFSNLYTASATYYTMTASPEAKKKRDALMEKYKDKLDDPITAVNIEKEITNVDREYINQDPNKGFYIENKSIDVVRKKLHYVQGMQTSMDPDKPARFIKRALTEPMQDVEDIPYENDGARYGSYNRGKMTALGGEGVKFVYRIYSASSIVKEDCKTPLGRLVYIAPKIANNYIGSYIIDNKGNNILLTAGNIKQYTEKEVMIRTPGYCRADPTGRTYCLRCFGEKLRGHEKSLAAAGVGVPSVMNTRFMKAMHVDALSKVPLILAKAVI